MFRLHSAQRNFLTYQNVHPDSTNFYRSIALEISGDLNIHALQQAMQKVAQRHEMLRCHILTQDGQQTTGITPTEAFAPDITTHDATCVAQKNLSELPQTLHAIGADTFFNQPFDLENGPLWRAAIVKTEKNQHQFTIVCHPVIADERSINIWLNEIASYYDQIISEQHLELPTPIRPTEYDRPEDNIARQNYWREKLEDLTFINFHAAKPAPDAKRPAAKHHHFTLSADQVKQLQSSMPNLSLEQIMLAAMYTLLFRYTGDTDITVGSTTANRPLHDRTINAHANWLGLRQKFNANISFQDLAQEISATQQEALAHQLGINEIYQSSLPDETRSVMKSMAPFDILLTFNNKAPCMRMKNLTTSTPVQLDLGYTAPSYFHLTTEQLDDGSCSGLMNYNTQIFDEKTIENIVAHFGKILSAAADNPTQQIADIQLMLDSEASLITRFTQTERTTSFGDQLLPEAFSTIARNNPDMTALVFHPTTGEPQRMSYKDLEIFSNQIANYLREHHQLKTGDIVAISITRSINLAAFMLGAMKAGVIIAPLETDPGKLVDDKLTATNAALIITDNHTQRIFTDKNIPLLNVDEAAAKISNYDDTFYKPKLSPDSPAYIMYSSGTTTGIPKGALLPQESLVNLLNALFAQNYPQHLQIYSTALPTFDALLFDFVAAWAHAGTVHLTSDAERLSPDAAVRIITQEKINFAVVLPSFMVLLPPNLPLEYLISIGSEPDEHAFAEWHRQNPDRHLIDGRGHTETGICLELQEYQPGTALGSFGPPISNMKQFILDDNYSICPIGIPGNEYVSGPGIATKYIGNPALTEKKFLFMKLDEAQYKFFPCGPNTPGAIKLYATGDRGCYQLNAKGEVSFKGTGRTDRAIKLHGVSVNLGGVEAMTKKFPHVNDVVVTAMPDMSGLIAYVVRNGDVRKMPAKEFKMALRTFLRKQTPLHPVTYPKHIILMTKLPTTDNGKINYRKLPAPPKREPYIPQNSQDIVQVLTGLWKDVLGSDDVDELNPNASFNELGGHSIELAILEIKINRHLVLTERISVSEKFLSRNMTINSLANALRPLVQNNSSVTNKPTHSGAPAKPIYRNHSAMFLDHTQQPGMKQIGTSKPNHRPRNSSFTFKK